MKKDARARCYHTGVFFYASGKPVAIAVNTLRSAESAAVLPTAIQLTSPSISVVPMVATAITVSYKDKTAMFEVMVNLEPRL